MQTPHCVTQGSEHLQIFVSMGILEPILLDTEEWMTAYSHTSGST
jgi:hypothetical protein